MKRLKNGSYAVRLVVSADVAEVAAREALSTGCFGPEDYLNAVLNTAMLEVVGSEGREESPGTTGDLDDGIPF